MSTPEQYLVDGLFPLEKFEGKGGWTYVATPSIKPNTSNPFGWVQVSGVIDDYKIVRHKLMPMGDGRLFFPVRSEIRKAIKKEAGQTVRLALRIDTSELMIPPAILACFECEVPALLTFFRSLPEGDKKAYIDWIYSAKKDETFESRIAALMRRMEKKLRFNEGE